MYNLSLKNENEKAIEDTFTNAVKESNHCENCIVLLYLVSLQRLHEDFVLSEIKQTGFLIGKDFFS